MPQQNYSAEYFDNIDEFMIGYSKSQQLGKTVNPKKKKADGSTLSRTEENKQAVAKLKVIYISHDITLCEYVSVEGEKCVFANYLSFAHKKKRRNLQPGEIDSINETLLLCPDHHQLIEFDPEETKRLFELLRPLEENNG